MTVFEKVWNWVEKHPLWTLVILAVLVALVFMALNGFANGLEAYRARRFDEQQAAHEKVVAGLLAEREAAIRRADAAESKALLKETEAQQYKNLIYAQGGKIEAAADKLQKDIETAKADAGKCAGTSDPRACTCDKLRRAGFDCR